jgi:type II secretory pathway component GspD/PulD (secretin)
MRRVLRILIPGLLCAWFLRSGFAQAPASPAEPAGDLASATAPAFPPSITPLVGGIEGKISLDLRNIDIIDALKFLALKAGLNIITTKAVAGRVTLIVENAPVKDVFDIMLRSNNLAYDRQGEIYNVMTQEEYKALYGKNFSDIRKVGIFHIKYAIPEHIFNLVDALKSDIGRVLVDTESGTVMILDSQEKIDVIGKALEGFESQNVIKVFQLNYARAKDVEEVLKTQLDLKKVGLIKADERNNQVVVQTLPDRMGQIEGLIGELDHKTKEIIIETYIVQVKLSDELNTGVEWEGLFDVGLGKGLTYLGSTPFTAVQAATDAWRSRQQVLNSTGYVGAYPFSGTTTNQSSGTSTVGAQKMHLGVVNNSMDFDSIIKCVQTLGSTRILSNPKLAVVNNQEAKIHVGTRDAYVTTTTTTGQTTSTISENITFIDVGVLLSVVPNINEQGFVTLKVKAEVNSIIDTLITPTKNQIPILDTSLAETTVMVKEGSTVIIGGLRKETTTENTNRTPVLGSIPFLGKLLFTEQTKTKERTELIIILTPKLITGEALVTGAGTDEYGAAGVKALRDYPAHKGEIGRLPSEVFVNDAGQVPIKGAK